MSKKYIGTINFDNKQDLHAKVKTAYRKTITMHIVDEQGDVKFQINFFKPSERQGWKHRIKKDKEGYTFSGYFESIIIPNYIKPQLDSFIDNHLVDTILLGE